MNRKKDIALATIAVIIVCLIMACTSGCDKKVPLEDPGRIISGTGPSLEITTTGDLNIDDERPVLKVGQVWEHEPYENPFRKAHRYRILELKEGYVKYRFWKKDGFEKVDRPLLTGDMSEDFFVRVITIFVEDAPVVIETEIIKPPAEPNEPPIWGKGELPDDYQKNFGNSNGARLNFMQSQWIDRHTIVLAEIAKRILVLEGADPNEVRSNN